MIAKEVYRVLKQVLSPWFKANGFKLGKESALTYVKRIDQEVFVVRFQCHHHGWEKHKGSKFTVWIGRGNDQDGCCNPESRLTRLMSFEALELVRARQNRVLRSVPPPPPEYINEMRIGFEKVFADPKPYFDIFLSDWKVIDHPYSSSDDIWFRYFCADDVRTWAILLHNHIRHHYEQLTSA